MADKGPRASINQDDGAPGAQNSDQQPGSPADMDNVSGTQGLDVVNAMRIRTNPPAAGALAQHAERVHYDKVQEVSTDKEDGQESGILHQVQVKAPLAALVTVSSRAAEGTLEYQHPDSEPSSPMYDPTKPSLPCYAVPRHPLSDNMFGSQSYPAMPSTATNTTDGHQGTQAALTGSQPQYQSPTATNNTAQDLVLGLPASGRSLGLMQHALLASLKPKPSLGQARADPCDLQAGYCNTPAHKVPMQLPANSMSFHEPTHLYGKMSTRPAASSIMKDTTTGGTSSGSFQPQTDGAMRPSGKATVPHFFGHGGASTSAGLGKKAGVQQHKRARFGAFPEETRFFRKGSPVQSMYTADELVQQHTLHDDGGAFNHPSPAEHHGNGEPQVAGYANEMPSLDLAGPGQAPCVHGMLKMSTAAPHAWASPAMLAARSKLNKEWRVCSIHVYPTHASLFEQHNDSLKWLAGVTGTELQPAGSALPPPRPNLMIVIDLAVTETQWLEDERTGLEAPWSAYLACGAVVVTSKFVNDMHKKAIKMVKMKYAFWYHAAYDSLFNTGAAVVLSASVLDDPTNDFQVTRVCDRISKLKDYLPSNSISRVYVAPEKYAMLLEQGRLQLQIREEKIIKILPAEWAQTDPRSPVPEVCQQALEALKRHNDLSDMRKKAQHHRGSTQYLTLRYILAVTLDPVLGKPATPEAERVMRNSTGGNSTIIGAGLQQASCFLDALIQHVNCR